MFKSNRYEGFFPGDSAHSRENTRRRENSRSCMRPYNSTLSSILCTTELWRPTRDQLRNLLLFSMTQAQGRPLEYRSMTGAVHASCHPLKRGTSEVCFILYETHTVVCVAIFFSWQGDFIAMWSWYRTSKSMVTYVMINVSLGGKRESQRPCRSLIIITIMHNSK